MKNNIDYWSETSDILLVDDSIENLKVLSEILTRAGYKSRPVNDPHLALEAALAQTPTLILLDVRMPKLSGFELCHRFKEEKQTHDVPIIFVTALEDVEDKLKGFEAGAVDFISKPYQEAEILARIDTHLQLRHTHLHLEELVASRTAEIKESEAKYRGLVDNSVVGVFSTTLDGQLLFANEALAHMFEFNSAEQMIANGVLARWLDLNERNQLMAQLQQHGSTTNFEAVTVTQTGQKLNTLLSVKLIGDTTYGMVIDITKRKKAEAENLKNKIHLQKAQEVGQFGSWELDLINDKLFWSDWVYKIFEMEYETPINFELFLDCIYPEDRDFVNQNWQNALNTGYYDIEHRVLAGSSVKWVRETAQIVFDENKQAKYGIGVVQDISARKKAEKELREKEEMLHTLLNAPLEVIMLVNRDGVVLSTNQGGANSFGMSTEGMIGQSIYQYMPENIAQKRKSVGEEVFKTGKAMHFEDERNGEFFASSIYPVFDASGEKVISLAVFASNITDRKVMEKALIESEAKYRSLVDNALIGVFNTKTNGQIVFVNEALAQMYDYDGPEQMMGEKVLLHWIDPKKREQFLLTLQEYGTASNFEAETISRTGRHIQILISATLEAGDISGMIMDITEQKKIEIQILDYQKRLKDLAHELTLSEEKIRKQIAVDLHDHVGQMLSSTQMRLGRIIEKEESPEQKIQLSGISEALVQAVKATRAAIFDLSPPQLNEIGLYAAVHDWLKEQLEHKHGITTSVSGDAEKIPLNENARFMVFRCIKELANNTLKHARARTINVNFTLVESKLEITVQDDGIGFQFNADQLNLRSNSFGLFFIQERLLDMGGSMKVNSKVNQGTSIVITIPVN